MELPSLILRKRRDTVALLKEDYKDVYDIIGIGGY
jgi:hypothetical protein